LNHSNHDTPTTSTMGSAPNNPFAQIRSNMSTLKPHTYALIGAMVMFVVMTTHSMKSLNSSIHRETMGAPSFIRSANTCKYHVETSDSLTNDLPSGFEKSSNTIDKSKTYDICTVGAGLSGTVFAERSANMLGMTSLVLDNRPHIGGNCYDFIDQKTGILRNQYGAHLFHTSIQRVWDYVNSFEAAGAPAWVRWDHEVVGLVDGQLVPIPVNINTVNRLLGTSIQSEDEMKAWLASVQIPCPNGGGDDNCENAEQMAQSRVGVGLYEKIFRQYTLKQWAKEPKDLDALVTARIPVRSTFDPRYFSDKYQALPSKGYTAWFAHLLDNPKIDVAVNVDFFEHKEHLEKACGTIVYTGPIDRYFEQTGMEKLEYRSIKFTEERHYNTNGYILPKSVVNYPGMDVPDFTRAIEYKYFLEQKSPHTIVVKETSSDVGDPYYPVPNDRNQELFAKYRQLADELEKSGKVIFAGRLANYKYFNMDQALDNALTLWEDTIMKTHQQPPTPQ